MTKRFTLSGLILLSAFALMASAHAASGACIIPAAQPPHINIVKVRQTWLSWYNRYRARLKLPAYQLNDTLNATASVWSANAVRRGLIDHKRTPTSSYYDYPAIEQWFKNQGVTFVNMHGITFTENIGWGPLKCPKDDCTDAAISAIKSTFDFYLAEKGKKSDAHYSSIINKTFTQMGVGLAVDPKGKYYLTVHFAAKINSKTPALCQVD